MGDLESNFSKKMGPIRERWISQGTESELFGALFAKFDKKLVKTVKRNPLELKDIPGLTKMLKHPMVQMAIKNFGIDLSEYGINLEDFDDDADEDDREAQV